MKKYDFDFKISVVEAYKNGLTYQEIREKFHVTKTCFYDWLKLYNTKVHQKEETFTYKQYKELKKKFDKISRELEIIKLSHCFADSPRKQKEGANCQRRKNLASLNIKVFPFCTLSNR